jgi:two-component system, cell cycle sensor histidine kinase and response regulator CckA
VSAAADPALNVNVPPIAVPIEQIPLPVALLDGAGAIVAANSQWRTASPQAASGWSLDGWCASLRPTALPLRNALRDGVRQVLSGGARRFVQHEDGPHGPGCIHVSACGSGALVAIGSCGCENGRDTESRRMETVGRMVGGVAHDFANLVTLISGYSDLLLNRVSRHDPLRSELDEIRKAADRGARLTAQLLGFTRGHDPGPREVDLNALVADMQSMLRPILGETVELAVALAPDLGRVVADPGQMEQVIMNLILNARDAMPSGGAIRIESANSEVDEAAARDRGIQPGPSVLLSVSDTGHGIDSEDLPRVFQPFFTTKEKGKGTGLGLSTVQNIMRQSGGDVQVRSAPGAGAVFTLCLPMAPHGRDPNPGAAAAGRGSAASAAHPGPGSETILLVEDEDGVRRLLSNVLERQGYRVLEAADGAEAEAMFRSRPHEIQLVLTDVVMPGINGRELGRRLREISPGLVIVYMSGYTDDVLARAGALGPGMSFLPKPLRPEVLAARIREALDSRSRPFNPR